jgi:ubiquinone/menaquinone biosynthesis C-methylase UbiE
MTFKIQTLLFVCLVSFSLQAASQWENKHGFCGAPLKKWQISKIRPQASFLSLKEKDTIVDIGASSGWFEGAIACVSPVDSLHFVLLDIDSGCLTPQKLSNMTSYYSRMKGGPIHYSYDIVINTGETLGLPNHSFSKILVRNTLHEVVDQPLFAQQVAAVTIKGGDLYIIEVLPTAKKKNHGGCHMPLLTFTQINTLFEKNGFLLKEKKEQRLKRNVSLQLLRFVRT